MLAPEDRGTLLEILEPPEGLVLDAAIGLTYTLDLKALLSIPTAFAVTGHASMTESGSIMPPLELLDALRNYADLVTVYVDSSGLTVPSQAQSGIFSLIERCVVPVTAPRGGVFHPKLWAVRFRDGADYVTHRLVISSRNLTFDRSWDTVVVLEETTATSGHSMPAVAELLRAMGAGELAVGDQDPVRADRTMDVADTVKGARFEAPADFDHMTFHHLGLSAHQRPKSPLPREARSALVVSPFLKRQRLTSLPVPWDSLTVVSRADELDREFFDHVAAGDVPRSLEITPSVDDISEDQATLLSGLHAKIWVFNEAAGRSRVLIGSANATNAAFESNVEILLELGGPTAKVGVARWTEGDESMAPLLVTHYWKGPEVESTDHADLLDQLRRDVASWPLHGTVEPRDDGRNSVRFWLETPLTVPPGVAIRLRPLALATWTALEGGALDAEFILDTASISAFLAIRLESAGVVNEFLLKADLEGIPADRDAKILAALLANPERLVRYLLLLLADPLDDRFSGDSQRAVDRARRTPRASLPSIPLLEVMARALVRQPERLRDVDRLMSELERGADDFDVELLQLWRSVRTAAGFGDDA